MVWEPEVAGGKQQLQLWPLSNHAAAVQMVAAPELGLEMSPLPSLLC